jgi:hypothetical protein
MVAEKKPTFFYLIACSNATKIASKSKERFRAYNKSNPLTQFDLEFVNSLRQLSMPQLDIDLAYNAPTLYVPSSLGDLDRHVIVVNFGALEVRAVPRY